MTELARKIDIQRSGRMLCVVGAALACLAAACSGSGDGEPDASPKADIGGDAAKDTGSTDTGSDASSDGASDTGAAECGNGVIEGTEMCDGTVANGSCDQCALTCDNNYDDCNKDVASDGCEGDLTSNAHCGGCDQVCAGVCTLFQSNYVCIVEETIYPGTTGWASNTGEDWDGGYWFTQAVQLSAGWVYSLGVYTDHATSFSSVKFALYRDNGGEPGERVTATIPGTQEMGAFAVDLLTPLQVTAGTYWVAAIGDGKVYVEGDVATQRDTYYVAANFLEAAPATWPTDSDEVMTDDSAYSLFVTMQVIK